MRRAKPPPRHVENMHNEKETRRGGEMPPRHVGVKRKHDEEGKTPPRRVENMHNEKET